MFTRITTPVARGLMFVVIAAIAWGTGGIIAAVLYRSTGLGPIAISFWRTAIGVVLLALVYTWRRPASAAVPKRPWVTPITGVGLAVYQTAYYAAVARSGVAFATVLTLGAAPILIALSARLTIGERLGPLGVAAVAVAPVGLVFVVGGSTGGSAAGVVFSLVSATGYAVVTVLHRSLGGVDPARTTLRGFVVAGVCLAPLAIVEGLWPSRGLDVQTVVLLGYLGVFATAVAYSLFFASLGSVRATTVSILTLSEPLTAAALAVLLLGERLTWSMAGGAVILLGAVVGLARAEARAAT
jgi:drug/metabolite transporter, DME family